MLTSLSLIILCGFILNGIFLKLRLPGLLGMLITGIILGPYALNLIDPGILAISADLREIALIVILARAGLSLDLKDLKKVGRPAILMCFIPATFEIAGTILLAPRLLGISIIEAAIMGAIRYVLGAGLAALLVIVGALIFRTAGTSVSLIQSGLNLKEKLFCNIGYLPKATVQAAVGAIPLAAGIAAGNIILSVAVLSIIVTAPLGALGIDLTYRKLLQRRESIHH